MRMIKECIDCGESKQLTKFSEGRKVCKSCYNARKRKKRGEKREVREAKAKEKRGDIITLTKRGKRKNPRTNRMELCYLCSDGVWRFLRQLREISQIEGKTDLQAERIIRTRIGSWDLDDERMLGPITEKQDKRKPDNQGRPTWEGLVNKDRSFNLRGIPSMGSFEG